MLVIRMAEDNLKVNQESKYEPAYQTCNKQARALERQEWIDYTQKNMLQEQNNISSVRKSLMD